MEEGRHLSPGEQQRHNWLIQQHVSHPRPRRMLTLPHTEVCMHLGVAGKQMMGELIDGVVVQLFDEAGRRFSFPITRGEAGWV